MADKARRPEGTETREGPAEGPAARKLLWALAGAAVYTLAYLAAKHFFGF